MSEKGGGGWGALAGAVVGGTLGAFAGPGGMMMGASLGASIGGMVGNIIEPPDNKLPNVQGPMEATINTYHRNLPVPIVYGVCKVGGNVIWLGNVSTRVQETGGGKGKPVQRKIFYSADWAVALSEGPIQGVGRIWINEQEPQYTKLLGKETSWRAPASQVLIAVDDGGTIGLTMGEDTLQIDITGHAGSDTMDVDPHIAAAEGSDAPYFRGTGYLLITGQIGQVPQIPNISTETAGRLTAIDPASLRIPIIFSKWKDYHQWSLNNGGTFTFPGGDDLFYWWTEVTASPCFNRAANVEMDLTEDFEIRAILNARGAIFNGTGTPGTVGANIAGGIVLRRRSDNSPWLTLLLSIAGGYSGVPSTITSQADMVLSTSGVTNDFVGSGSVFFQQGTGSPYFLAEGQPNEANVFVEIKKTGLNLSVRWATIATGWHTLLLAHWPDDVNAASFTPATVSFTNQSQARSVQQIPTFWVSDFYMKYVSTVPTAYVQSANPVCCVYDFLTNPRYGVGFPVEKIDVDSFGTEAAFCDVDLTFSDDPDWIPTELPAFPPTVDLYHPSLEPRFQLDIPLTEKKAAFDHLDDMLATFRGYLVRNQGTIKIGIEKKVDLTDPDIQEFTDTPTHVRMGIIEGSFEFSEISGRDRPNRVKVEFVRGDDLYRRDFVVANDEYDQELRGEIVEKTYTLIGIKRPSQASRMVQYFQDFATQVRYLSSFKIPMAAMKSEPGDLCKVTHGIPGWSKKPMRILTVTENDDQTLTLKCIEYVAAIYHDKASPAILDPTPIVAPDIATDPPNAIRLRVFESRTDSLPRIYVTWSLDPAYGYFLDTFLYRKREEEGLFVSQGAHVVNATTGFVRHARIGFAAAPAFDSSIAAGRIAITNATGLSAKVFDSDNNLVASAVASGAVITLDVSAKSNPFNGYIQLYGNGTYSADMYRGRYPDSGSASLIHQSSFAYQEEEITYSQNPPILYLENLIGALPDEGTLQLETAAGDYTDAAIGLDGDRVEGLTWPNEPIPYEPDNRITDAKVYQKETATHVDRTAGCLDPSTTITLFPGTTDALYIGSATKKLALLHVLLSRVAGADLLPVFQYSNNGTSGYADAETVVDGTGGFTQSGLIGIEPPQDWVKTNQDNAGNVIGDGVQRYYLRIARTLSTVVTTPQERRFFLAADLLATLQEDNNRVDYYYTDDDRFQVLTFEALAQNVVGSTADTTRVPLAELTIQAYSSAPPAVQNLQIDSQGNFQGFLGGDLVINWLGTSRAIGAGRVPAGEYIDGAGGGSMDPNFQDYVVQILDPDGNQILVERVLDVDGTGTYTYGEADRQDDGLGLEFRVNVYQEADNFLSPAAVLSIVPATMSEVLSIEELEGFGQTFVPSMSDVVSLFDLPGISGIDL